jgi:hypothetical protein
MYQEEHFEVTTDEARASAEFVRAKKGLISPLDVSMLQKMGNTARAKSIEGVPARRAYQLAVQGHIPTYWKQVPRARRSAYESAVAKIFSMRSAAAKKARLEAKKRLEGDQQPKLRRARTRIRRYPVALDKDGRQQRWEF